MVGRASGRVNLGVECPHSLAYEPFRNQKPVGLVVCYVHHSRLDVGVGALDVPVVVDSRPHDL